MSYDKNGFTHVQHQKTSGDAGGFTAGPWKTRELNVARTNTIGSASLNNNQITLPPGTYYFEGSAPAFFVDTHQVKLKNVSYNTDQIIGTSEFCDNVSGGHSQTRSFLSGRVEIVDTCSFELQHRCAVTRNTNGLGKAAGFPTMEVYAELKVWELT